MATDAPEAPVEEHETKTLVDPSVTRCEKCDAPTGDFAVCRACGYYSKLGKFVDIDHEMEGFEVEKPEEPFRLPKWTFGAIIGCVGILAEAITLSFLLPLNTWERLICSILHIAGGLICLLVVQVRASFLALMDDMELSAMDCIACPPRAWGAVIRRLPESKNLVTIFFASLMAILMSLFVLRTIPYGAIFGGEPPPKLKSTIISDVLAQAPEGGGEEMDMEDAVKLLAEKGTENLDPNDPEAMLSGEGAESEPLVQSARAVVIGFNATSTAPKAVRSVVVATANMNPLSSEKWRVLGTVPIMDETLGEEMYRELSGREIGKPITPTEYRATWVRPSIKCEVSFQERPEDQQPYGIELKQIF